MDVEVVTAGLACTVQDRGRPGHYDVGIPPSGAVDQASALAANLLVGNPADAAVIECPYLGPTLGFTEDTVIAVTGAELGPTIDGENVPSWTSLEVKAGHVLAFGLLRSGARAYIAVSGGVDVPVVLGSRSTYALGGFGGHQGRVLQVGDRLATGARPQAAPPVGRSVPQSLRPSFSRNAEVRVVLGLYDYRLTSTGQQTLIDSEWTLTPVADRTGFRYRGPQLEWQERVQPFGAGSDPSNIVDAGYPVGSIQVPGGVEPIVLHRDAVSGGGYAMVATVISADMDLIGQCAPGTKTRFRPVSLDQALTARADRRRRLKEVADLLNSKSPRTAAS